ncbi:molybdenum cofactor guanylyltransferase [Corynebacterium sp. CNCTC7651]
MTSPIGVIILAGGRSSRMGADKAQVRVDGSRLIDVCSHHLPAHWPRVVVSPQNLDLDPAVAPTVSEDPPFGGPVAGIAAGLARLTGVDGADGVDGVDLIAVVAVDAPRSGTLIPRLAEALDAAGPGADAASIVSADGRIQPLCALWRRRALEDALAAVDPRGAPAMALLRRARAAGRLVTVPGDGAETDYDTPEELAALGRVDL